MVRHQAWAGHSQGPVAAVHCLLESVVNNVKGTGDTRGFIDALITANTMVAAVTEEVSCCAASAQPGHLLAASF
jgi:hypothetical protein